MSPAAWLTPDEITEGDEICRPLVLDRTLVLYVTGALLPLTQPWNWESHGTMTPQQASEYFTVMLANWVGECSDGGSCTFVLDPEFGVDITIKIIRRGATGHTEELVDGEWVTPTEELEVPPIPERPEATELDRFCMAAANAAHVLELMYEEVTDAIAVELSVASVFGAIFDAAIALVGAFAGPTAAGFAAWSKTAFDAFVETADTLGNDVWTGDFTDELTCFLYGFTQSDGNVVTFEFPLVRRAIFDKFVEASAGFDVDRALLWGQVGYLLDLIAAGGLDTAGATTGIADYDCTPCIEVDWCWEFDFTGSQMNGFTIATNNVGTPWGFANAAGVIHNILRSPSTGAQFAGLIVSGGTFPGTVTVERIEVEYDYAAGFTNSTNLNATFFFLTLAGTTITKSRPEMEDGTPITDTFIGPWDISSIFLQIIAGMDSTSPFTASGTVTLRAIRLYGRDLVNPFGTDNCTP